MKNKNSGFTLVELIVVIAIMILLSAIIVPKFIGLIDTFKIRTDTINCEKYASALEMKYQLGKVVDGDGIDGTPIQNFGLLSNVISVENPPQYGDDMNYYFAWDGTSTVTVYTYSVVGYIATSEVPNGSIQARRSNAKKVE